MCYNGFFQIDTSPTLLGVYCASNITTIDKENGISRSNKQLGAYLAGLWEGDGHIVLPVYNNVGKLKNTPCFAITASVKQLPLFEIFQKTFGGWIRHKQKENAIVWTITARAELINIVFLLNGNVRSLKIDQFNQLIDYLNNISSNQNVLKKNIPDCSELLNNYWLAGFIDADGGFKIRYTEKKINSLTGHNTKQRIAVSVKIEQRMFHKHTNAPFKDLMQFIADFFEVKLTITTHENVKYWCVEVSSLKRMKKIIDYLTKYPLLSSKRNDYCAFKNAYNLIITQQHLTVSGKKTIFDLKQSMNRKRTQFDWSHLT